MFCGGEESFEERILHSRCALVQNDAIWTAISCIHNSMILETVIVGPMQVNCYILALQDNSGCLIIDPGAEEGKIRRILDTHSLKPELVINTHGHFDHIGCDDKFGVPVYVHKQDARMLLEPKLNLSGLFSLPFQVKSEIRAIEDKDLIDMAGIELEVIHLPGHTPGGIALFMKKPDSRVVFTGDSLFFQGIGRSDLEGGSEAFLVKSIKEKLFVLPDDTVIYPGTGRPQPLVRKRGVIFFCYERAHRNFS